MQKIDKTGLIEVVLCHIIWGLMPLYWRFVSAIPALEVLASRMVWAAIFTVTLCVLGRRIRFLHLVHDRRALKIFLLAGLTISLNWGIYIWAVNSGHVLETSIGYYLCPLVNIFCGIVFFKERLTLGQKLATALAAAGALFFIAVNGGAIWIALVLATSFAFYGAVKKKGGYPALPGMAFESLLTGVIGLVLFALGFALPQFWQIAPPTPAPVAVVDPTILTALMVGAGIMTAVPLLLFSAAANKVTMTILGFAQYIGPTLGMFAAIFLFGEELTLAHTVCFGLIWLGIAVISIEPFIGKTFKRTENCD